MTGRCRLEFCCVRNARNQFCISHRYGLKSQSKCNPGMPSLSRTTNNLGRGLFHRNDRLRWYRLNGFTKLSICLVLDAGTFRKTLTSFGLQPRKPRNLLAPAIDAWIAAFNAKMLVWSAISLINETMLPISCEDHPKHLYTFDGLIGSVQRDVIHPFNRTVHLRTIGCNFTERLCYVSRFRCSWQILGPIDNCLFRSSPLMHLQFLCCLMFRIASANVLLLNKLVKPVGYQLYDKNGVANVRPPSTQKHIPNMLLSIDRNMQVDQTPIVLIMPWPMFELRTQRESLSPSRREQDLRLKPRLCKSLKKQSELISKKQLQQLQKDKIAFETAKRIGISRKGEMLTDPTLKAILQNNAKIFENVQKKRLKVHNVMPTIDELNIAEIINRLNALGSILKP
ncbi:hypothetical protein FQR65_LT20764 [Abscondita terminalis]|nr:hypothetical protein FQR65_LT20764 [Abscondita terminalis]